MEDPVILCSANDFSLGMSQSGSNRPFSDGSFVNNTLILFRRAAQLK